VEQLNTDFVDILYLGSTESVLRRATSQNGMDKDGNPMFYGPKINENRELQFFTCIDLIQKCYCHET
jgi:hypothetical protein